MMKILFELSHPAHGHLFKNSIKQLMANGHKVTVTIKDISVLKSILENAEIPFIIIGKKGSNHISKLIWQVIYILKIIHLHYKYRYNLSVGVSITLPIINRILHLPSIVFDDDDKAATPTFANIAHKFTSLLLRPMALLHEGYCRNTGYYSGYHELAYLHPDLFVPDISVLKEQGLSVDETYFIIRLVSLKAHHDSGIKGINEVGLSKIITFLLKYGRVILTSESMNHLQNNAEQLRIHPSRLHHLMAFSKLVISDGQTMCSEASCLGVPSIRINDFVGRISYLEEQEKKWGLTYGFKPDNYNQSFKKMKEIISDDSEVFKNRRNKMVESSINVAELITWIVENFPLSKDSINMNPIINHPFN